MEYKFSDRVQTLKPSAIREIFKYAADPSVVSLSAGNPSPEAFPVKEIDALSQSLRRAADRRAAVQRDGGLPRPARDDRVLHEGKHNVGRSFDAVLVTSGAQQVMDLLTKSVCNEGDVVICERRASSARSTASAPTNARLRGVPMEPDGMDMDKLETALREEPRARFIYTIPNFQNPSGITMSWKSAKQMYSLAKKYGVLILEDNPYGDLRFSGEHVPPIKSLDEDGIVVYCGSFSKVISPGIRVGYAIGPQELLQKMIVCKAGRGCAHQHLEPDRVQRADDAL